MPTAVVPNFFFGTGQGAIVPVIPLFALSLGYDTGFAAFAAGLLAIGQLAAAVPAGWMVSRLGERNAMLVSCIVNSLGSVGALTAVNGWMLMGGVALMGMAASGFQVARHAYMATAVPLSHRGRAFSVVAGGHRLGMMVGPFIGSGIIASTGQLRIAFTVPVVISVMIIALLTIFMEDARPERHANAKSKAASADVDQPDGIWRTMVNRRDVLVRLGFGATMVGAVRTARQILVPLWGVSLGLDTVDITLLVGICAAIDFALFYVGGQVTDRFGRFWVAVPTLIGFAVALFGLAATEVLPGPKHWYVGLCVLMAVANGISSALVAAMGADLADMRNPAAFLSSWRLVAEFGPAGVPVVISAVTATASLATASIAVGVLAVMGVVSTARYLPVYLPALSRRPSAGFDR